MSSKNGQWQHVSVYIRQTAAKDKKKKSYILHSNSIATECNQLVIRDVHNVTQNL